ncbi:hypothetical protein VitviT2T_013066 [Vitis vinifera]|uniref:Fungal lipase-type domain-containing protein n=1 Tax=Vitis vinifera TaxID=29760 RepID=A0ABY9CFJ8_VITVI|nr:triacylglycerol lipase OBL1 [Vitis vinifera]WJZ94188.1 hypothetical protein VitviT2T_013066 [Vitis vinifera]|eukprot:XP_002270932.2 PREDICTED: uncharacterized protein LOC100246343 [Vitis vinifera]
MATEFDDSPTGGFRYLIVRPENGGIADLVRGLVRGGEATAVKFVESSDEDLLGAVAVDHRWVILVSVIACKIIAVFGKPMEWTGCLVEFLLNLFSQNGSLLGLLYNLLHGKVVIPQRGSETFISTIGHLDGRIDLYKRDDLVKEVGDSASGEQALMDLCIIAAKLAYENANVIRNIVVHHWKMHFVDFYNGWNDFQKQCSTQVFILCDKPKDANLILISFRGTEPFDADDWSTDFDYSWYEIPKLGKVHMGFLEALGLGDRANAATFQAHLQVNAGPASTGRMLERTAYYAVRNKLKSLLMEHKKAKFIVTGHSLGGALAILFPTVLLLHEEKEVMQRLLGVYTFGQPRVGNQQLGKFMEAQLDHPIPKYFRVVYCNDLVPRLPYDDNTFLYKHFGVCLYYDSWYIGQKVDEEPNRNYFGSRYLITEYLNAVWELMRSLTMGYMQGPEYKEGWLSIFLRVIGLALPGVSAHSPTNYVNSVRLGKEYISGMSF